MRLPHSCVNAEPPPVLTSIVPNSIPAGPPTTIVAHGTGFKAPVIGQIRTVGWAGSPGNYLTTFVSETEVNILQVALVEDMYDVWVKNGPGGDPSNILPLTVTPEVTGPVVTSAVPASLSVAQVLTGAGLVVHGTGFTDGAAKATVASQDNTLIIPLIAIYNSATEITTGFPNGTVAPAGTYRLWAQNYDWNTGTIPDGPPSNEIAFTIT